MKTPLNVNLKDKVIIITGAAGFLMRPIVEAVAVCGAKTALIGRTPEPLEELAMQVRAQTGRPSAAYPVDVLEQGELQKVRKRIIDELGPCDILLNGAGGNRGYPESQTSTPFYEIGNQGGKTSFFNLDLDKIKLKLDVNFLGTFIPTQIFAQDMIGRSGCSIINISSMNAILPLTCNVAYSAAKCAITNFSKWLAVYLAKQGIRVNVIAPGFFVKSDSRNIINEDGTPTERGVRILEGTPFKRFASAEELTGAALFLMSEEAAGFITGIEIPVDGGFTAYSGV